MFIKDEFYIKAYDKRRLFKNKVIAVTGSNGKTNLCKIIYEILSKKYRCNSTLEKTNSIKGIPYCINKIFDLNSDYWIIEVGISSYNEMEFLIDLIKPDIKIINNLGIAHTKNFKNTNDYHQEKLSMLKNSKKDTIIIINDYCENLKLIKFNYNIIKVSEFINSINYKFNETKLVSEIIYNKKIKINYPLLGKHLAETIATAICLTLYLGIPLDIIKNTFLNFTGFNNHGNILKINNNVIFNFSYNANYTSMYKNLVGFNDIQHKKKLIILGDMLELTDSLNYLYHKQILLLAKQITKNIIIFTESFLKVNKNENYNLISKMNINDAIIELNKYIDKKNYFIFIQGSNSTNTIDIVKSIF